MQNDNDENEKQRLLILKERAEAQEREALEEELYFAKKKEIEDIAWQKNQAEKIQKVGSWYKLFYKTYSVASSSIKLAGNSIGFLSKVFPPLNAVISGMFAIVDLVESIFISRETRNRRAVKITNSVIGTGLSTAAVVLSLNPATAPLGLALSAGAMAVASAKDSFFWYKASRDLRRAKEKLLETKNQNIAEIHKFIHDNHHEDVNNIHAISDAIIQLESTDGKKHLLSDEAKNRLSSLRENKKELIKKIDLAVNGNTCLAEGRWKIANLKNDIRLRRKERNEKRNSFFTNFTSFIGTTLIAVSAFLVAAAVVSNPLGLAIAGIALIGIATTVSIKNKFFTKKEKVLPVVSKPIKKLQEESGDGEHIHQHLEDTERIVHQLALGSKKREAAILKADIEHYRNADKIPNTKPTNLTNVLPKPDTTNQPTEKEKNSENPNRFNFKKH